MGLYDTVWVKCPKCGKEKGFQSKSGPCELIDIGLDKCPDDILSNVNRHSPYTCECGVEFEVDVENKRSKEL